MARSQSIAGGERPAFGAEASYREKIRKTLRAALELYDGVPADVAEEAMELCEAQYATGNPIPLVVAIVKVRQRRAPFRITCA